MIERNFIHFHFQISCLCHRWDLLLLLTCIPDVKNMCDVSHCIINFWKITKTTKDSPLNSQRRMASGNWKIKQPSCNWVQRFIRNELLLHDEKNSLSFSWNDSDLWACHAAIWYNWSWQECLDKLQRLNYDLTVVIFRFLKCVAFFSLESRINIKYYLHTKKKKMFY